MLNDLFPSAIMCVWLITSFNWYLLHVLYYYSPCPPSVSASSSATQMYMHIVQGVVSLAELHGRMIDCWNLSLLCKCMDLKRSTNGLFYLIPLTGQHMQFERKRSKNFFTAILSMLRSLNTYRSVLLRKIFTLTIMY